MMRSLLLACFVASLASADYWRYSIPAINCIETREWTTDHLGAVINMVAGSQNITSNWIVSNNTVEGNNYTSDDFWKDITLQGNEPNLTVALAVFNYGDKEPQEMALRIISAVLEIPKRFPLLGIAAEAIDLFLDIFKGAYQCEGPVAIDLPHWDQTFLQGMAYNQSYCKTSTYSYQTGPGCVNVDPTTTKYSKYELQQCIERHQGESSAHGGRPMENSGSLEKTSVWLYLSAATIATIFTGWL